MENWLTAHPKQINGVIVRTTKWRSARSRRSRRRALTRKASPLPVSEGITDALHAVKKWPDDVDPPGCSLRRRRAALDLGHLSG